MLRSLLLFLVPAAAVAQVSVSPASFTASVPQHQRAERVLTVMNEGSEPLAFCLSFDRPLEEVSGALRLAADAVGGSEPCPPYGEVFARIDREDIPGPASWDPYGLAAAPDGRVFVADFSGTPPLSYELTPTLEFVRAFEHPTVEEVGSLVSTTGVTYRTGGPDLDPGSDHGALWWLNSEESGFAAERVLMLEGNLDGMPTGRRARVPVADEAPPPAETDFPVGLAYDAPSTRFYFLGFLNRDLWAVDTLGTLIEGYPLVQQAYPPSTQLSQGLDVHRGVDYRGDAADNPVPLEADPDEGLWLEVGVLLEGSGRYSRIVALAADDGTWPGGIETPIPVFAGGEGLIGEPVRSRLDPNGALYYALSTFGIQSVVGVHPHPLPPSWLVVGNQADGEASEAWRGTLEPGESREVSLSFRAGARAVGTYQAALQAFAAESGAAVEVPLTLTITESTASEQDVEPAETSTLQVWPNPARSQATVAVDLRAASALRVAVFDVLGRRVTVLHDGSLGAGDHAFDFDAADLPSGVYVVRATTHTEALTRRLTLLR